MSAASRMYWPVPLDVRQCVLSVRFLVLSSADADRQPPVSGQDSLFPTLENMVR